MPKEGVNNRGALTDLKMHEQVKQWGSESSFTGEMTHACRQTLCTTGSLTLPPSGRLTRSLSVLAAEGQNISARNSETDSVAFYSAANVSPVERLQ